MRFELKSPVKTIEDFLRRFTPSCLTSGCSSIGSLAANKSNHKSGSSFLSTPSSDGMLLRLESLGQPTSAITSNGYSSQADDWASELAQEQEPERELRYEAESPDEAALVYAARAYNCVLVERLHDQVSVELPHLGRLTFDLLHTLGFDSIRKRMSVVIRHPLTNEINVYTKGADSVVMDLLQPCSSGTPTPAQLHPGSGEEVLINIPTQFLLLSKVIFINPFPKAVPIKELHGFFRSLCACLKGLD